MQIPVHQQGLVPHLRKQGYTGTRPPAGTCSTHEETDLYAGVAHATWHHSSCHSQERQQLLSALRAAFLSPLSRNILRLILPLLLFSNFCASTKSTRCNSHQLTGDRVSLSSLGKPPENSGTSFYARIRFLARNSIATDRHLTKGANTSSRVLYFSPRSEGTNTSSSSSSCLHS